jgi:hypothetical protein
VAESELDWLQRWYKSQCNGDWEHQRGIQIGTLDNPGWRLSIDVHKTVMENRPFQQVKAQRNEDDWIHCWIEGTKFHAAGGPLNLSEAIATFRAWVEEIYH